MIVAQIKCARKRKRKYFLRGDNVDASARESRKKYYAEWRAKNRNKVKEYNARYWAKRAEREAKVGGHEQKEGDANNG